MTVEPAGQATWAGVGGVDFRFAGYFHSRTNVMVHAHPCVELVLVHRGSCTMDVAGATRPVQAGEVIVIPNREPHDQRNDGDVVTYYVGGSWPAAMLDPSPRVIDLAGDRFIHRWMGDLVDHYKHESLAQPVVTQALLAAVVGRIRWCEEVASHATRLHPTVAAAVQHIELHLREPLTVGRLAEVAGCSPSHLTALFRAALHESPMAFLARSRLSLACKHLLEPYLNVKQVGAACGWRDANLFVRVFRQHMGCPPGEWRARQQRHARGGD